MNFSFTWFYLQETLTSKIRTLISKKHQARSQNVNCAPPESTFSELSEADEATELPICIEEKSSYELAWDYALGRNVDKNLDLAMEKMQDILRNGSGEDCFKASQAFWTGYAFPHDPMLSIKLLKRAYELNFNVAMSSRIIGGFYRNNLDDIDNAIAWFTVSSEHKDSYSAYALSNIYSSLEQHDLALQWMIKSANLGDHTAEYMVGFFYEKGQGVAQDYHEAFHWYEIASNNKEKEATKGLARLYKHGKGTERSISKAEELYASINAHWELALMHLELYNNEKAIEHLLKLPYDKDAMLLLGSTYCHHPITNPQYHKAIEPYTTAAKLGETGAMFSLGELYLHGKGIPKNYKESYFWFSLAQANGAVSAQKMTANIEQRLTPTDLSDVQNKTIEFYNQYHRKSNSLELS
ncbi:sel1 repeat family protein [Aeromonas dhakensis]|uniref:tetratricopeptide repeat protein n=1 Tax=Aeromonas dhakensis TaxID=196024 RepID=UPI00259F676D|nr:tetratricopeptide repeat protein [Aeromonas dhakensis]MDM5054458.1 sel1 repeat family protein [Aeromonas dhakensis]MDM5080721.1 sel1 repeat family protein [Aeromonas dhakensis]